MKTIIVNLFGGPGAGKSTTAAGLFSKLKVLGVNCELVTEFAKDVTWQGNYNTLRNQVFVHGQQHNRIFHLKGKVEIIITDSPTLINLAYCDWNLVTSSFERFVVDEFKNSGCQNINIFVNRKKGYKPLGRNQSEDEAKSKDDVILKLLEKHDIDYVKMDGNESLPDKLVEYIMQF